MKIALVGLGDKKLATAIQSGIDLLGAEVLSDTENPESADVVVVYGPHTVDAVRKYDRTVVILDNLPGSIVVDIVYCANAGWLSYDGPWSLVQAILDACDYKFYLSPSVQALLRQLPSPEQYQVLRYLIERPSALTRDIAKALGVSDATVNARYQVLRERAGAANRAGVVLYALRHGWLSLEESGIFENGDGEPPEEFHNHRQPSPEELDLLAAVFRWPDVSIKDMASALGVPIGTVRGRVRMLHIRLNVSSRAELILKSLRQGLIKLDGSLT
jgi:DNA-binding NarL/FixJ family response regulator